MAANSRHCLSSILIVKAFNPVLKQNEKEENGGYYETNDDKTKGD